MVFDFISQLVGSIVELFNSILNTNLLPNISLSVFVLFVVGLGIVFSFPRYFL